MLIVIAGLHIVRFIGDSAHHIRSRKPPAVVLVISDRPHLAIIEKPYRLITHYDRCF